jgi:hypothetical protein
MGLARLARAAAAFVAVSALASPVFAQGYVGAFLVADVVRLDQYDSRIGDSGNGEALGFALRLGTEVGRRWGVEVEFVRPGEITSDRTPDFLPLLTATSVISTGPLPPGVTAGVYDVVPQTVLPYSYLFRSTQRRTTLAPALWVRQEISRRFSLAYVGGVAFGRTESEIEISYAPIRPTIIPIPPSVNESVNYDVAPMVGVEGRIRMAGAVALVPGLRLHGTDGGWLIRPSLGIAWTF